MLFVFFYLALSLLKGIWWNKMVLWEGNLRQPKLGHLVLWKTAARVKQILKILGKAWVKYLQIGTQFSRITLSGSFKRLKFLKRLDLWTFLFKNG